MLKILEDVIGGYIEHQGIRVGIQQIYSISIDFSEGVSCGMLVVVVADLVRELELLLADATILIFQC
jgi:hypothetical protein